MQDPKVRNVLGMMVNIVTLKLLRALKIPLNNAVMSFQNGADLE